VKDVLENLFVSYSELIIRKLKTLSTAQYISYLHKDEKKFENLRLSSKSCMYNHISVVSAVFTTS